MVLAFNWIRSGRPACRIRWSNQGTVASPIRASAHSAQASAAGNRRGLACLAGRVAAVTLAVILVAGTSPPASLFTRHCRRRSSRKRYGGAQRPHSMADPPPGPRPLTPPISKLFRINLWVYIIALIPESWRLDGGDAWSAAHAEGRAGAAGAGGGRAGVRAQRLCGDLDGRDRRGGGHRQADDLPRLRGQARAVRGDPRIGQRA